MGFSKGPTPPNATFPPPQAKGLLTTMIAEKNPLAQGRLLPGHWHWFPWVKWWIPRFSGLSFAGKFVMLRNHSFTPFKMGATQLNWNMFPEDYIFLDAWSKLGSVGGTKKKCAQELPSLNAGCNGDLDFCVASLYRANSWIVPLSWKLNRFKSPEHQQGLEGKKQLLYKDGVFYSRRSWGLKKKTIPDSFWAWPTLHATKTHKNVKKRQDRSQDANRSRDLYPPKGKIRKVVFSSSSSPTIHLNHVWYPCETSRCGWKALDLSLSGKMIDLSLNGKMILHVMSIVFNWMVQANLASWICLLKGLFFPICLC